MPWLERTRVVDRIKFMLEWEKRWEEGEGHVNVAELCREFGVSRKTGYKWRKRCLDIETPMSIDERSDKQLPADLPRVDYELGPFVYRLPRPQRPGSALETSRS